MTIEMPDDVWREAMDATHDAAVKHAEMVRVWPQYAESGALPMPPVVMDACTADYNAQRRAEKARDAVVAAVLALLDA